MGLVQTRGSRRVVADRSQGSRGVVARIDEQLEEIDRRLAGHQELLAERGRLLAAKSALTGESVSALKGRTRLSSDTVAAYLAEHPGSRATVIAKALGSSQGVVSACLYRGRETRFERRADGWYVR
jgi:lambda repressor-like predicted transcriptional regulator